MENVILPKMTFTCFNQDLLSGDVICVRREQQEMQAEFFSFFFVYNDSSG